MYIGIERSFVCLVRYTLTTCGKRDAVVQIPAIVAIKFDSFILRNMILPAANNIKQNQYVCQREAYFT